MSAYRWIQTIFQKIFDYEWDIGIATGGWKASALLKLKTATIQYENTPMVDNDYQGINQLPQNQNYLEILIDTNKNYRFRVNTNIGVIRCYENIILH